MDGKSTYEDLEQIVRELEIQSEQLKESEERYRSLVEEAPISIVAIRNGCILFSNPAGARMLGFTDPDKMVGILAIDIVAPESQQFVAERIKQLESGKDNPTAEIALIRQDEIRITVESKSVPILIDGIPTAVIIARDITERKRAEKALSKHLEFERLIAGIAARLANVQPDTIDVEIQETLSSLGRFLKSERAFVFQFSYDGKSLKNTHVWAAEGISPQSEIFELDLASVIPWVARQIRSGRVIATGPGFVGLPDEAQELRLQLERDGINSGFVVPISVEGRPVGMLGLDTVDKAREYPPLLLYRLRALADMIGSTLHRIRAQRKLQLYRHIVESTTSIVGLVDHNYVYQYVNDAYCAAFKKDRQEIIGGSVADLVGQEMFDRELKPHYDRCFTAEEVIFQSWGEFPGWGNRYMDVRYSPFFGSDGKVAAIVVSAHDITEIKQLEMELKESQARFRAFMENIPGGIYIKNENDVHLYCNQFAAGVVGMKSKDVIGSRTRDLHPPTIADRLIELDRKVLKENIARVADEYSYEDKGRGRWYRDIKFPIQLDSGKKLLGGIAIDITEIKLSEQKLRDAYSEIEQLKQKLEQENIYLRQELEINYRHHEIVGESTAIQKTLHQAEKVANEETTVLILGETGTGKELLARAIHRLSPRRDGHMVKVNCAALPANLVESELFGREKGAFTGAMARQMGRFESADGSTIFLDEIGDLPLELQTKLLRVLQEGQFERLGSIKTISVDVRVIAATNRDLRKAVHEGRFRRDLYYRLNVFPITIPPLRERRDDIPLLTWAFVKHFSESMGKQISTINKKCMDRLKAYSWPGNVRELKNVIERSMILITGPVLHIGEIESDATEEPLNLTLDELERAHILNVIENTGWRVRGDSGAARILGLKPTTLEARMKKLGIQRGK